MRNKEEKKAFESRLNNQEEPYFFIYQFYFLGQIKQSHNFLIPVAIFSFLTEVNVLLRLWDF
jgi:hypothetical protein